MLLNSELPHCHVKNNSEYCCVGSDYRQSSKTYWSTDRPQAPAWTDEHGKVIGVTPDSKQSRYYRIRSHLMRVLPRDGRGKVEQERVRGKAECRGLALALATGIADAEQFATIPSER